VVYDIGVEGERGQPADWLGEKETTMNTATNNATQITEASLALFVRFAKDSGNWGGMCPVGGNVTVSKAERGNLTDLQIKGLITLQYDSESKMEWVYFTASGKALAASVGHEID